jgi:hypothetical protein
MTSEPSTPGFGRSAPVDADRPGSIRLHLGLLGHFQRIIYLDAEVANRDSEGKRPTIGRTRYGNGI